MQKIYDLKNMRRIQKKTKNAIISKIAKKGKEQRMQKCKKEKRMPKV